MQTAVTWCFTNLCLRFSSKETLLRVLRPRQADVKSALISPRPQARPRLPLRGRCHGFAVPEGLFAQASCGVIPSQCSHWRGNQFPAPAGAESPSPPSAREVSALRADGRIVISGRTEPSAPTHVLMCRVSVPCLSLWERWPSAARTERANHDHTGPLSHLR